MERRGRPPEGLPEKLRSNIERLYITVIRSLIAFGKEIVLLRSWQDPIRTGSFCSSRIGVGALLFGVLAALVLHPPFRTFLFPPRPSERLSTPPTGLPSDSFEPTDPFEPEGGVTSGEQEELDARQFAQEFADLASAPFERDRQQVPTVQEIITEAVAPEGGSGPGTDDEGTVADADDAAAKAAKKLEKKQTKVLAKHGLPIQAITGDLADAWERWANVLAPTSPPFAVHPPRVKVALHILPIALAFLVLPSAFIMHTLTFAMGFLFFADPILSRIAPAIDAMTDVDWREAIQIRYSMLNGVPSNTQLTIRLLRDAELAGTPLPPPPPLLTPTPPVPPTPSRKSTTASVSTVNLDVPDPEVESYLDSDTASIASSAATSTAAATKTSGKAKFASLVRGAAKLTEQGAGYVSGQKKVNWETLSRLAVDKLKVATGSDLPEHFMSVVPSAPLDDDRSRSTFYAHRGSAPGHLLLHPPSDTLSSTSQSWTLEFRRIGKAPSADSLTANVTIPISDITELRRTAGLGWKGRIAAGWIMGAQSSVGDGIEIVWGKKGEGQDEAQRTKYSAIVRRDELFNRLASVGPQTFEHL
ncbi:hypothetical protein RQP46_004727 [Phenoliferia psychrophenolica]